MHPGMNAATASGLKRDALVAALFSTLFVALLFFTPQSVLQSVDYILFYRPNFQFLLDSVKEGRIPLWNPYVGLGRPFLADVQNAVFYPPIYLTLLGPAPGVFLLLSAHVMLATLGMQAFGKALGMERMPARLIALSFAASLSLTGRIMAGQILYACALCYVPVLFYLAMRTGREWNRKWASSYAVMLALQFLCGHPQVFWFSTLGQGVFILARAAQFPVRSWARETLRSVAQFGAAVAFCFGLVAVVLLPFLELVSQGNRSLSSLEYANFGRLEWLDLFSFFTDPPYEQWVDWEKNFFVGSVVLVAGVSGLSRLADRNVRGLLAVALSALILALGDQSPLFRWFYEWVPGYSAFRVHCRSGFLIVFALLTAAGLWLGRRETTHGGWMAPSGAAGAILLVTWLCFRQEPPRWPLGLWMIGVAGALLCLLYQARRPGSDPRVGRVIVGALVVVQLVDLANTNLQGKASYTFLNIQKTAPEFPYQRALVSALDENGLRDMSRLPPRVLVSRKVVPANLGMIHGYSNVDAYTSLFLRRPWDYVHKVYGLAEPTMKNTSLSEDLFKRGPFSYPALAVDVELEPVARTFLISPRPPSRVFLVHRAVVSDSYAGVLDRLTKGHDIEHTAVLEEQPSLRLGGDVGTIAGSVTIAKCGPDAIQLRVETTANALLVLAEAWYPGWKAQIGDATCASIPANVWMRAFPVPAGKHDVRIFYRQNWLLIGMLISVSSLAMLILWARSAPR